MHGPEVLANFLYLPARDGAEVSVYSGFSVGLAMPVVPAVAGDIEGPEKCTCLRTVERSVPGPRLKTQACDQTISYSGYQYSLFAVVSRLWNAYVGAFFFFSLSCSSGGCQDVSRSSA